MRRLLALTLVVLGCTAIAQAQRQPPPPPNPLSLIPAFACSFPKHAATEWTATGPVTAMLSATGLNVIEQTGYGNFILTTIFVAGGEGRVYLAAHSRHLGDLKTVPSVSQHFGTCQPVQATR